MKLVRVRSLPEPFKAMVSGGVRHATCQPIFTSGGTWPSSTVAVEHCSRGGFPFELM